jgi:hypothetical protein
MMAVFRVLRISETTNEDVRGQDNFFRYILRSKDGLALKIVSPVPLSWARPGQEVVVKIAPRRPGEVETKQNPETPDTVDDVEA